MTYRYEEFLEDLSMGREIHFIYREEEYYIGCGTGKFMFWKLNDADSEMIGKDMEDLLLKVKLDGKLIIEIWKLIEIDTIF